MDVYVIAEVVKPEDRAAIEATASAGVDGAEQGGSDRRHRIRPPSARADRGGRTRCAAAVCPYRNADRAVGGGARRRRARRSRTTGGPGCRCWPTGPPRSRRGFWRRARWRRYGNGCRHARRVRRRAGDGRDPARRDPRRDRGAVARLSCIDEVVDAIGGSARRRTTSACWTPSPNWRRWPSPTAGRRIPGLRRHSGRPDDGRGGRRRGGGHDRRSLRHRRRASAPRARLAARQPWSVRAAPRVPRGHRPGFAAAVGGGRGCTCVTEQARTSDAVAEVDAMVAAIGPRPARRPSPAAMRSW